MKTLACPECHEVMHSVDEVTAKSTRIGISQLAQHCTTLHVVPAMERMLDGVASMGYTADQLLEYTEIVCPNCGAQITEDSFLYIRKNGRTMLCCSQSCLEAAA